MNSELKERDPISDSKSDSAKALNAEPAALVTSLRQPAWHVLLLGVLTCKLYLVYWYYKNLRDLASRPHSPSEQHSVSTGTNSAIWYLLPSHLSSFRDCNLLLRGICACIPYVNDYLFLTMALGVAKLQPEGSFAQKHAVALAVVLLAFSVAMSLLAFAKDAWYLLYFLSVLPAAVVQHLLNKYWQKVEAPGLLFRAGFTGGELLVVIAGALFLGFIIAGFILGVSAG